MGAAGFAASAGLLDAVLADDAKQVETLLKQGANPNEVNSYGVTPLWLAATNGSESVTKMLLKAGADAKATMPHGETALMAAARTGRPEVIVLLLNAGADPNARETQQGETALMWAAAENHTDAIRALIKGGANPNQHGKGLDLGPWKWMNVGMVDTMLPRGGFTAAMYAARQNMPEAIKALAESGANLDERDADGATALHLAIVNQHYDTAIVLLNVGASPNVQDNSGMSGVYAAVDMAGFRSDIGRPNRVAQDKANALDVLKAALEHGGDPNLALTKAIIGRHHGGGDAQLGKGSTAVSRAIKGNDMASVRLLAAHGANLNVKNSKGGETALHAAAKQGKGSLVKELLELGADPDVKDNAGKTALDVVAGPGRGGAGEDAGAILREFLSKRGAK